MSTIEAVAVTGSLVAIVAGLVSGPRWVKLWLLTILGGFVWVLLITVVLALV